MKLLYIDLEESEDMTDVTELVVMHNPVQEYKITWIIPIFYTIFAYVTALIILAAPLPILGASHFTEDFWYAIIFKFLGFLLLPVIILSRSGYRIPDIFYRFKFSKNTALTLVVTFFIGLSVNMIGKQREQIISTHQETDTIKAVSLLIMAITLAYLVAGIPEELIFRWFVMSRLEEEHHWTVAVVLSSLFFTMWHLPTRLLLAQGSEGTAGNTASVLIGTGLPVFFTSCILGILWKYKRSLPHLMLLHGAIDIIPIYASLLGIIS